MPNKIRKNHRAIYAGTFDPVTYGHIDLMKRALVFFDDIIVAVAKNEPKKPLFSLEERMSMIRKAVKGNSGIRVESFSGLVVDFARQQGVHALIRGIRMLSDFESEFQMALINRKLNPDIETFFLMPSESYTCLTSRLIKEISLLGGDVRDYVPPHVHECLKKKFSLEAQI